MSQEKTYEAGDLMPEGVFQTDRVIFNNPIWKNPAKFRLFFYIYGNAIFSKEGFDIGGIHLSRGQLLKSYRKLSDELEYIENHSLKKYSISHIKKLVDELIKEKRLEIKEVIRWCQKDSFWQGNILSPGKLREKYDQLTMRMKSKPSKGTAISPGKTPPSKFDKFYQ